MGVLGFRHWTTCAYSRLASPRLSLPSESRQARLSPVACRLSPVACHVVGQRQKRASTTPSAALNVCRASPDLSLVVAAHTEYYAYITQYTLVHCCPFPFFASSLGPAHAWPSSSGAEPPSYMTSHMRFHIQQPSLNPPASASPPPPCGRLPQSLGPSSTRYADVVGESTTRATPLPRTPPPPLPPALPPATLPPTSPPSPPSITTAGALNCNSVSTARYHGSQDR